MTIAINPQFIHGHWIAGVALDLQTTGSVYLGDDDHGHPRFDTTRSSVGELLYQLKYRGDQGAVAPIVAAAMTFLKPHAGVIDVVVPVLPSTTRRVQPVYLMAEGIAHALGKPIAHCVSATRQAAELKQVDDHEERARLLDGLYTIDPIAVREKNVLLFDDLFRSGATMNAIADALTAQGGVKSIRALTITRTRSRT